MFSLRTIKDTAAIIGLASALVTMCLCLIVGKCGWLYSGLISLITLAVVFALSFWTIDRFVLFRIKPIYKILLSKDIQILGRKSKNFLLESIQDELNSWAEKNDTQIALLEEREQYRKEFMGNISHELKTPIFNIQGYILTLLDGGLEDSSINRKYLERAEKSIDRLINIVEDLNRISRLETNALSLDKKPFDIVALAREIGEDIEMVAQMQDVKIVVGLGANQSPIMVYAEKLTISQVLTNLMVNGIKYRDNGGFVSVNFTDVFDHVMVEVSDDGLGIAKEHIPRLFERFYRMDKGRSREQGGTGLGLAIVKHVLEAHGQSISLRSELGKGSTFAFSLEKPS